MNLTQPLPRRIGLMADSHDQLEALRGAIRALKNRGVSSLIHLGDICDSLRPDLLEDSIHLLQKNNIFAIKGNNDFTLEKTLQTHRGETSKGLAEHIAFLQALPLKIAWDGICFCHALPFDHHRAIYEPVDMGSNERAEDIFNFTSHRILFCGHSHRSVLFRWNRGKTERETIPMDNPTRLDPGDRYIFVAGSVIEGECAIFDTKEWSLRRIPLTPSG